jgi:serine/threonine-protein kinase
LQTPANEGLAQFSRDGRYVAYVSDESGRFEVYVRPFPVETGKWRISSDGGNAPRWSADGKELFYVEGTALVAAAVSTEAIFQVGASRRLFESADLGASDDLTYDAFPDARRFVTIAREDSAPVETIRVVENWYEEFRDRQPE